MLNVVSVIGCISLADLSRFWVLEGPAVVCGLCGSTAEEVVAIPQSSKRWGCMRCSLMLALL